MSYTRLKTMLTIKGNNTPLYKENAPDHALGLLKNSAFAKTDHESADRCYSQHSYEHEIACFVEKLMKHIEAAEDTETGRICEYSFSDEERFDEKHLLWGCFDLLIKADLTIGVIKQERMELLKENMRLKKELERGDSLDS